MMEVLLWIGFAQSLFSSVLFLFVKKDKSLLWALATVLDKHCLLPHHQLLPRLLVLMTHPITQALGETSVTMVVKV